MQLLLLTIAVSMGISFLCSVLEACLLSLSLSDIARLTERKPLIGRIWRGFKTSIHRPIAAILIINTLAHTIGASLSGAQFNELFGARYLALFSIVYSLIMIQWTEILPKTLGVRYNTRAAVLFGLPLQFLTKLLHPVVWLTHVLNRPFESKGAEKTDADAIREISALAHFAAANNQLSGDQEKILARLLNLSKLKTRDIMVDKSEIKFLSTDMTLIDALATAHVHHHTRLPLVENGDVERIIGYVNFKDIVTILKINPKDPTLRGICRPLLAIPGDENLTVALSHLTTGYQHMAVVHGPGGRVAGLVTLEDVIEAIVGDLYDEYDQLPVFHYPINETRLLSGGGAELRVLRARYGLETLPEEKTTLNDWLLNHLGRAPRAEEQIETAGLRFIVRKTRRSRLNEVIIDAPAGIRSAPAGDSSKG